MADRQAPIRRVDWCIEAETAFASHCDTAADLAEIAVQVMDGDAQLWRFEGKAAVWLVTRLERYPTGKKELVLVNGIGKNSRAVLDVCDRIAQKAGAESLRAHIARPALGRIMKARGWQPGRTIYHKSLTDEHQQQE